jgi:predicted dehydrogenase
MPQTKPPLDRRKFLGSAAALSLSAASYANVPGANGRVRVGFIGCGARAQAHIDIVNRLPDSRGVAVCDVWDGLDDEYDVEFGGKVTRRRYSQGLFPSARRCGLDPTDKTRVTKDYRRVLDLKDVDAVCVAAPDHWHGKMTADAMLAGKDVFVETPFARRADEAIAVMDVWAKTGRVVTIGVQSMADPVWVRAFDFVRTGKIGHVAHAQTGAFRNDARGQWRFLRLAECMTPKTVDWDMFLGHQHEFCGRPLGARTKFDRQSFAQWKCDAAFTAGPLTDLLTHNLTHTIAAMGVRYPGRVAAGGGLYLEYDGRTVPDLVSVIADYDEGCQLVMTAGTITAYPTEEVIRGRFGAIRFVKGGFEVFRDDPTRGAAFPTRIEKPLEPTEFVQVEAPRNETEALWVNFFESVRARRQSTFCPPDLGAAVAATTALAELSCSAPQPTYWDKDRRAVAQAESPWVEKWRAKSAAGGKPNQVFGWSAGDSGSTLTPPPHQRLAGPWVNGKDPAS